MGRQCPSVTTMDEPEAFRAERLLIAGDYQGAVASASAALQSSRRGVITEVEKLVALSVTIQAMALVGRFLEIEEVVSQTSGGFERLPTDSLLLWAAVGCEVGEEEHVGKILRQRLKFCPAEMPPAEYLAICRMYAIEVLAKASGTPEAAISWANELQPSIGPLRHQELMSDLASLEVQQPKMGRVQELPEVPSTPPRPRTTPEIQPEAEASEKRPLGGQRSQTWEPARPVYMHDRQRDSGEPVLSDSRGDTSYQGGEDPGALGGLARFFSEITPEQALALGVAGSAITYALYQERKPIARALRRFASDIMLLAGASTAAMK